MNNLVKSDVTKSQDFYICLAPYWFLGVNKRIQILAVFNVKIFSSHSSLTD